MNSLPRGDRGVGGAMNQTFQNSAQVLSIGIFFTLMIIGLSTTLPETMTAGLTAHGVPAGTAHDVATLPPVSILFAAFLGYNPIEHLLGPHALAGLSAHDHSVLTGSSFFPNLISGPFHDGLVIVFLAAAVMSVIGAVASFVGGKKFVFADDVADGATEPAAPPVSEHAHHVALAPGLAGEELLGLPGEQRIGEALERLAHHHEAVGTTRAEVQVAEPALPPPAAPLHPEHHEIEGVVALQLQPGLAATARGIAVVSECYAIHRDAIERRLIPGAQDGFAQNRAAESSQRQRLAGQAGSMGANGLFGLGGRSHGLR